MALFNSKEEFVAAIRSGVLQGEADYWRAFFSDEAGTGDTILDEVREFRPQLLDEVRGASDEALVAAVNGNTAKLGELVELLKLQAAPKA